MLATQSAISDNDAGGVAGDVRLKYCADENYEGTLASLWLTDEDVVS